MKQTQKIIATCLSLTLIFTLSACRTKTGGDTQEPDETGSGSTLEQKELVIWNLFDNSDSLKGQIQAFQSNHPGTHITYKKFVNVEEYWDTILNELAEGEGPDIFAVNNNWIRENQKKFLPLLSSELEIPMNPEIFRKTFFNVAGEDLIIDEQIYGIPLFIDTLALYYNKALFVDNIANSDEPAPTWEKIKEQVYSLTKPDNSIERFAVSGIAMGRADNIARANDILYALFLEFGMDFYNESGEKAIFNNQQGVTESNGKPSYPGREALELFSGFGLPSYKNYAWNNRITKEAPTTKEINPFVRGKVAMIFGYSYLYGQLKSAISEQIRSGDEHITEDDIGIAPFPQLYDYKDTGKQDAFADYYPLVVSRNTQYPELAWNLLLYLAQPESLQTYHEKTHKPTSRKDMVDTQSTEMLWGVFARQAAYAKSLKLYDKTKFNEYFAEAMDAVAASRKTIEEALELAQKKVNCLLDKNFKQNADQDIDCDTLL